MFILLPHGKNAFNLSLQKVPISPSSNIVPLRHLVYDVSFSIVPKVRIRLYPYYAPVLILVKILL